MPITSVCSLLWPKRRSKIAAGLPNRHSHRPIYHSLAPSAPGTRTPCGQTIAWPRSAAGPSYPLTAMPFYCSPCLPTVSAATQNISSPTGGEKHQNTEEEEKNIPPVCSEDCKILNAVLTYSGSCLVSREKFCWSVSGPGSSSILKLWVLFWCSRRRTSDLAEGKRGWSGGLKGPIGLWVLYEGWGPDPVKFLSSSWVSMVSDEVWKYSIKVWSLFLIAGTLCNITDTALFMFLSLASNTWSLICWS